MKRLRLVLAVAAVMAAMLTLSAGLASADSACFDDLAQNGVPPGSFVKEIAGGAATSELAQQVGIANQVREDVCQ